MKRNQPRREHLLNIAQSLFSTHGYHQTGIDALVMHSGVSKTTMYKYFETKNDLVLEVLKRRHEAVNMTMSSFIEKSMEDRPDASAHAHIDAIFDATEEWIRGKDFAGCDFINAAAEYADPKDPIHQFVAMHKKSVQRRIEKLLCSYPKARAKVMARQISLALDGAIVNAQVSGDKSAMDLVRSITKALIQSNSEQVN